MPGPTPYILLPGTAREALAFYAEVFGGTAELHTRAEFGRTDGPPDAVAHGSLIDAPVALHVADAAADEPALQTRGLMLALLGVAPAATSRRWFAHLGEHGSVVEDLRRRGWGAFDGRVVDRFGLHWLIGFETDPEA